MASKSSRAASLLVLACSICLGGCRVLPGSESVDSSRKKIVVPLQVVVLSDDDGGRAAIAETEHILRSVEFANRVYAPAGIEFEYDPRRNRSEMKSSLLNSMMGKPDPDWREAKRLGDETAAGFPDKLVLFYRHGPEELPTRRAFSWYNYGFVVLPETTGAIHCERRHLASLAHEVGHYLGLWHTFAMGPFEELEAAEAMFLEHGRNPEIFDGDGFEDTPPDPSVRRLECVRYGDVVLDGERFELPRSNIMSYYFERDSLTPSQIERVRWTLEERLASGMRLPTNTTPGFRIETERMQVLEALDAETQVQRMERFGIGDWSNGRQLLVDATERGRVTLRWHVQKTQKFELVLYATRAPDFGQVRAYLDDEPLGQPIDLYAPLVTPTGGIPLGHVALERGPHRLDFRVVGQNPASSGFRFGIDCLKDARW